MQAFIVNFNKQKCCI